MSDREQVMLNHRSIRRGTCTSEWHLTIMCVLLVASLLMMHGCEVGGRRVLDLPAWSGLALLGLCGVVGAYVLSRGLVKHGQRDEVWSEPSTLDDVMTTMEIESLRTADSAPLDARDFCLREPRYHVKNEGAEA